MLDPIKHRGTALNPTPRFDRFSPEPVDDGWDLAEEPAADPRTTITPEPARSIITRNDSPDVFFDQSINPYRGCEHGCVYCFARPNHAFLGLSPGLDFETRIMAKTNAPALLAAELRRPAYRCQIIAIGTNTDPYQPAENRLKIMRGCLEVMAEFGQPVAITTKGFLVTRDIDILGPMAARGLAAVTMSVTTLDRDLCRLLEPRAAIPERRIEAIRRLSAAGIPTSVNVSPIIPALTDHEMERILAAAREAGARGAGMTLLRLPREVKDLFEDWLATHEPGRAAHVLSLIRQSHGGKLYDSEFGSRYRGDGEYARMLARRFAVAKKRLGYEDRGRGFATDLFRPPPRAGDQMSLF